MDISSIATSALGNNMAGVTSSSAGTTATEDFSSILTSAMDMISETNELAANAEAEEIKFALGESDNTHDLSIAMKKAEIALQYTVAVKNSLLDAYKEIMNMQI
jgi:flagellar hook-basal body complex protein FliE